MAAEHPIADPEPRGAEASVRPRMGFASWAWLFVVVAIGVVQLLRRQWGDAAVFGAAAVLLAVDAAGLVRLGARARPVGTRTLLIAAAVAVVPLVLLPRHGASIAVPMVVVGLAAIAAVWPGGRRIPRPWPRPLRTLAVSWVVVWIAGCLWEVAEVLYGGVAPGGRAAHPALSDLLDPALDTVVGQTAFVVLWLAVGVFLVRRGSRR